VVKDDFLISVVTDCSLEDEIRVVISETISGK